MSSRAQESKPLTGFSLLCPNSPSPLESMRSCAARRIRVYRTHAHAQHMPMCAVCCVLCAVRCALCAVRCALCAVYCVLCTVCCVVHDVWITPLVSLLRILDVQTVVRINCAPWTAH